MIVCERGCVVIEECCFQPAFANLRELSMILNHSPMRGSYVLFQAVLKNISTDILLGLFSLLILTVFAHFMLLFYDNIKGRRYRW